MVVHSGKKFFLMQEDEYSKMISSMDFFLKGYGTLAENSIERQKVVFPYYQAAYLRQGTVRVLYNGKEILMKPGGVYLFKPFTTYIVECIGEEEITFDYIIFSVEPYIRCRKFIDYIYSSGSGCFNKEDYSAFGKELEHITKKNDAGEPLLYISVNLLLRRTMLLIVRENLKNGYYIEKDNNSLAHYNIVEKAIEYTENNINIPISIKSIAASVFVSENALYKAFVNIVKMSPQQFLLMYKIDKGDIMINIDNKTVTEAAESLGFASTAHFSRTYHRLRGYSPKRNIQHIK